MKMKIEYASTNKLALHLLRMCVAIAVCVYCVLLLSFTCLPNGIILEKHGVGLYSVCTVYTYALPDICIDFPIIKTPYEFTVWRSIYYERREKYVWSLYVQKFM